mgnify:CR=1 FL=1
MVIDTSALLHVLFRETGWRESLRFLATQPELNIPASVLIEAHAVFTGRGGQDPEANVDALLKSLDAQIIAVGHAEAVLARRAYSRYGKGRHKAALNFGDVISYAVAASRREPLVFVGDDFSHTDLELVRLPLEGF